MPPDIIQRQEREKPWVRKYHASLQRAKRKGFEHKMTKEDFRELWYRYKAWELDKPSTDRIDNKKGYLKENCRYIELKENQARDNRGRPASALQKASASKRLTALNNSKRNYITNEFGEKEWIQDWCKRKNIAYERLKYHKNFRKESYQEAVEFIIRSITGISPTR